MANTDLAEIFNSPEMREKFHPLAPEIVIKSLFVYVRSCIDSGINPSEEPDETNIDAVVDCGRDTDLYSVEDAEILRDWMKAVLDSDVYRELIFENMRPGWQN